MSFADIDLARLLVALAVLLIAARGGPGIVLASTAYAAGIVNQAFFVSLLMLSVVTSLIAGSWLERIADKLGAPGRHHDQAGEERTVISTV